MKNKIVILIIMVSFFACQKNDKLASTNNTPPKGNLNGFFDIDWEVDVSTAVNILKEKNILIQLQKEESILAAGKLDDYYGSILLRFSNRGFYSGYIVYEPRTKIEYDKYVEMFKEKYGKPNSTIGQSFSEWDFENNCSITIAYNNNISLLYTNEAIANEVKRKIEATPNPKYTIMREMNAMGFAVSVANYQDIAKEISEYSLTSIQRKESDYIKSIAKKNYRHCIAGVLSDGVQMLAWSEIGTNVSAFYFKPK